MDYDPILYSPDYRELLARRAADPLNAFEQEEEPMLTNARWERIGLIILISLAIVGVVETLLILLGSMQP